MLSGRERLHLEGVGLLGEGLNFEVVRDLKLEIQVLQQEFRDVQDFKVEHNQLSLLLNCISHGDLH